ncbi:hypothetical protein JFU58_04860 [Pseudomonas sp. TH34]|jgi:hypothetical protein|uniref:hypothetical protein n=1 Tax=Pseudomonas TaxID=286 RepID=UPI0007A45C62|nr:MULTISPECIES: hypothetical protein [Pseudomonas]AMW84249.1 hypothetical protein AK972_3449 [Pseudomonas yamanorum]MBK5407870.1 hypothetical protein [Pseudomonas sp. TH34]NVZ92466.1 hypothetical protein [Pseudomonas yamanorum]WVN20750.1 hypothetical protein VYI69_15290 [Pseudomonas yamanorum]SDT93752.1 hypothetical protein SAMN05216237_0530 [Pseudomonas yamanorum]
MNTAQLAIQHYILAKDGNRPHLLSRAFVPEATLDMVVRTGSISFPPHVEGVAGIGDVLVRRFGQTFENVYTFCLGQPPEEGADTYLCKWLVGMSDKNSGEVRVGCGVYEWQFNAEAGLVERLTITIEHMKTLPASDLGSVMSWVSRLSYPWCSPQAAVSEAPDIDGIGEVLQYFAAL